MSSKFFTSMLLTLLFTASSYAHEYWFEPGSFFLTPQEKTAVHLYVGDGLVKDPEERVWQPEKTPMFSIFSARKNWDLKTSLKEGTTPIYVFSGDSPGTYLLAMERNWSYIKIEAQKFEDYLREDGMEFILPERIRLGESKKEGRERYSRYIKTLLQVGDKRDDTYKKTLGLRLEITPLENPYNKKIGDTLKFKVVFDGQPLVGRTVFADNRTSQTQKMVTDKRGIISIKIDKDGLWLVRVVNMQRCKTDCGEADWESFWGALTFGAKA